MNSLMGLRPSKQTETTPHSLLPERIARLARGEELRNEERYFLQNTIAADFCRTPTLPRAWLRHEAGLRSPRPYRPIPALPVSWSQAVMADSPAPAWRSKDADRRKACWPDPASQKLVAQTASAPSDSKNAPVHPQRSQCLPSAERLRTGPPMLAARSTVPA
jgi:hypothetical protein